MAENGRIERGKSKGIIKSNEMKRQIEQEDW